VQAQQLILGGILGAMMFAIALDLRVADFRRVARRPWPIVGGMLAQFLLLPVMTWLATLALDFDPAVETGMLLVASAPGGNMSNFITHLARGSTAMSVSMTAMSSVAAIVMMPLNFGWTVAANPATAEWVRSIEVDSSQLIFSLIAILGLPLAAGMTVRARRTRLADALRGPLLKVGLIGLGVFIIGAAIKDWANFESALGSLAPLVVVHNAVALALGALAATVFGAEPAERRAVTIEVGMQNSALALGVTLAQFGQSGAAMPMIVLCSLWGVWHIISGSLLAAVLRRIPLPEANAQ
jgi:BASS family bile acid:Na+ symporter